MNMVSLYQPNRKARAVKNDMNMQIECTGCGYPHTVNPDKHEYRPKWCMKCRKVLATPQKTVTAEMMERIRVAPAEISTSVRALLRLMMGSGPRRGR